MSYGHEFTNPTDPIPRDIGELDPVNLERVSTGESFPVGRTFRDGNEFLLMLDDEEVRIARRLYPLEEDHDALVAAYEHDKEIIQIFADPFTTMRVQPEKLERDIHRLDDLIKSYGDEPGGAALQALRTQLYGKKVTDLEKKAARLTDLIAHSELELWVIAKLNYMNKDAVAARLKGVAAVNFGEGVALKSIVEDKNGQLGMLPAEYYEDVTLHTRLPANNL
jgi:hypothetical protein